MERDNNPLCDKVLYADWERMWKEINCFLKALPVCDVDRVASYVAELQALVSSRWVCLLISRFLS